MGSFIFFLLCTEQYDDTVGWSDFWEEKIGYSPCCSKFQNLIFNAAFWSKNIKTRFWASYRGNFFFKNFWNFSEQYSFPRSLWFLKWKLCCACDALANGQTCRIFGTELLKMYLIDSNVSIFENRKKYYFTPPVYTAHEYIILTLYVLFLS